MNKSLLKLAEYFEYKLKITGSDFKSFIIPTEYKGYPILIVNEPPNLRGSFLWSAHWDWNPDNKFIFYLEKNWVNAVKKKQREDLILEALEHEYIEANMALEMAKKIEPNIRSKNFKNILEECGGKAHSKVITIMNPNESEKEYDKRLTEELEMLDLI